MIILVKPAAYGGNAIRYATEKEKAEIIKINHMPQDITPIAMWHRMKMHCGMHKGQYTQGRPMSNFMVTFVISPNPEECQDWTRQDWDNLQKEVLQVLDSVDMCQFPKCKKCKPTNFRNSMNVSALHHDSASGVLHLHLDCCRLDLDGHTNDINQIHIRCMKAAEIINRHHGWKQPAEIREERRQQIANDCMDVLRKMKSWNFDTYFEMLRVKGYVVAQKADKQGVVHGYTISAGASTFKASDLDKSRKLQVSRLENTWKLLHRSDAVNICKQPSMSVSSSSKSDVISSHPIDRKPVVSLHKTIVEVKPKTTLFKVKAGGETFSLDIPDTVKGIFSDEVPLPDNTLWSTVDDITNTAMLLFCGYIDAATAMSESCGGGGNSNSQGWGRDKDENDEKFARRCIGKAKSMHTRKRGLHRWSLFINHLSHERKNKRKYG